MSPKELSRLPLQVALFLLFMFIVFRTLLIRGFKGEVGEGYAVELTLDEGTAVLVLMWVLLLVMLVVAKRQRRTMTDK